MMDDPCDLPWFWVYLHAGSPVYCDPITTSQQAAAGASNAPEVWCNVFGNECGPTTGQQSNLCLWPLPLLNQCMYPLPPHIPVRGQQDRFASLYEPVTEWRRPMITWTPSTSRCNIGSAGKAAAWSISFCLMWRHWVLDRPGDVTEIPGGQEG